MHCELSKKYDIKAMVVADVFKKDAVVFRNTKFAKVDIHIPFDTEYGLLKRVTRKRFIKLGDERMSRYSIQSNIIFFECSLD